MPTFDGNLALFQENAGNVYNAIEFRRQFQAHTNTRAGVLRDNDFSCAVVGTNVVVQTGSAYVSDTGGTSFGYYFARTVDDATTAPAVAITPNFTGGARTDIVTLRILDTARGDASNNCSIVYEVATTVSAFARSLVLFQLTVANGGTTVTSSTDRRQFAGTYQGITRCTSGTHPTSPSEGDFAYETDTDAEIYYDGAIWKRTGDQIPHSSAIGVVSPWAVWNFINPNVFSFIGGFVHPDAAQRAAITMSFVKQRADTKLLMTLTCPAQAITFTTTANYALMEMGLRHTVTGTAYPIWRTYFNTSEPRGTCTGVISVSGLAAGTYSFEPYLSQVAQFTIGFIDQGISFQITETL